MLEVELDAFSGRPNPRWELTPAQATEFLDRIRKLRPIHDHPMQGEGLGYRGFVVRPEGEPVGGFDQLKVYHGTVLMRFGGRAEVFDDSDRGLERWMLDTGRGQVPESVLTYVQSEIER